MNKFLKMFEGMIKKYAIKYLKSKKEEFIIKANKKINLPLLDEQDEKELLEGVWDLVEEIIDDSSSVK